jgi:hypothetical protein
MRTSRRIAFVLLVVVLLAVPLTAMAEGRVFRAKLSTRNEVPPLPLAPPRGRFTLEVGRTGTTFELVGLELTGNPTGIHLHAPANATQNAPIFVSLCGAPGPAAVAACPTVDGSGNFTFTGSISPSLLQAWGVTGAQLQNYLQSGLVYVNVHTATNPAGEIRGQLEPAP